MINCLKNIVRYLKPTVCNNVIPEITIKSNTSLPCITYKEYSNIMVDKTIESEYSELKIQIKIFSNDYSELNTMAMQVNNIMLSHGFYRTFSDELGIDGELQKIMRFTAKGKNNI